MDQDTVIDHEIISGDAYYLLRDCLHIVRLVPYRRIYHMPEEIQAMGYKDFYCGDVSDLKAVLLYRTSSDIHEGFVLEAFAERFKGDISLQELLENPDAESEVSAFWSRNDVTQDELAGYWETVVEWSDKRLEEHRRGTMGDEEWFRYQWRAWRITRCGENIRERLGEGKLGIFTSTNTEFPDQL